MKGIFYTLTYGYSNLALNFMRAIESYVYGPSQTLIYKKKRIYKDTVQMSLDILIMSFIWQ